MNVAESVLQTSARLTPDNLEELRKHLADVLRDSGCMARCLQEVSRLRLENQQLRWEVESLRGQRYVMKERA